ncbi:MAG TPA: hypothetical protein VN107_00630 [Microbacterium sp.]|nr:hypothetical protein [Microbacterium sp.]
MSERIADGETIHRDAGAPSRERLGAVGVLFLLVIVSVIPWRPNTLYSGGADPVVVAKAALALCALGGAVLLALRTRVHAPVGLGPAGVLSVVLLISLLGAFVSGHGSQTLVLVIRVFIVMATVLLLVSSVPWTAALACLFAAMTAVAVFAAMTGLPAYGSTGRLGGGMPEIHPNELAALAATPLVGLVVYSLQRGWREWQVVVVVVLLGIVVATGSRTALLGAIVALLGAAIFNGIRDRSLLYVMLVAAPVVYATATFTNVVGDLASRGGSNAVGSSLNSRFTAWEVVLGWDWGSWERWLGLGLSVEQVPVDNKWDPFQVLDSSWVSLLAQAGVLSVALVALLVIWAVASALVSTRRSVMVPLLAVLLIRSATESGLVDSAMSFVLLVTYTAVLTHRSRHPKEQPAEPEEIGARSWHAVP